MKPGPNSLPPGDLSPSIGLAEALFDALAAANEAALGFHRPPYGAGEQIAHDLVHESGRRLGLESAVDPAGNLHLKLAGADRSLPRGLVGSHLDTVPAGGNFDGAAGVAAGLAALHAIATGGFRLPADVTLLVLRGEEGSSWFGGPHRSHFGSRGLLGQIGREELEAATAIADGRSLWEAVATAGFAPQDLAIGRMHIDPRAVRGYIELHIEQGPVLIERGAPVGIVSGIRGNLRARDVRVLGEYAHSGAVPREYRRDAVFGAVELVHAVERQWDAWLAAGRDCVCTFGKLFTDAAQHSLSKVAGEVRLSIDIRSEEAALLREAAAMLAGRAAAIGARRGLDVRLGRLDVAPPAIMSSAFRARLEEVAAELGIDAPTLASGAGHDAANFTEAGIPAAMIFVRNEGGSHNPAETMAMADFAEGVRLLTGFLLRG
jgi:N-carbamoyl-L-amino-acid hydrolase